MLEMHDDDDVEKVGISEIYQRYKLSNRPTEYARRHIVNCRIMWEPRRVRTLTLERIKRA